MSPEIKEIDRPLGQTAGPNARAAGRRTASARSWAFLIGAFAIGAASVGLVAFRDSPFRTPAPIAVSTPEAPASSAAESRPDPDAGGEVPADRPGSSIVRVTPDSGSGDSVIVIRDPSAVGQNLRVAHLPDRALIEQSEQGPLPVRAADGRRPFDVYARSWSGARGARVAIVIGGLGLSQTGTQEAIAKLPSEITLAFAPHGNSLDRWMQTARREGHEIILQVPLEPFGYPTVNPGRHTLTVEGGSKVNLNNLRWSLARTTNYTGVMNYMGARFVAERDAMAPVMEELAQRGLLFLDDGSSARSVAAELALGHRVPFAAGDATIDADRGRDAILKKLDELERTARAKGFAIGTGSAFAETIDAVSSWANDVKRRGVEIVPISALASDPERG